MMRYCVIMCGGVGSRFWPYSRADRPKQFIDFLGTGRTLLQMTYDRMLPLVAKENMLVVTNERYRSLVAEQLPDLAPDQILCEPARRNTAPCVAWAAWHIAAKGDKEASMVVTPSDHLITREAEFESCMRRGFDFVESHPALLTLGVSPTRPETGYGYIQVDPAEAAPDIHRVKTFTEKPDRELARVFVDSGEFLWNSGIFLWSVEAIQQAVRSLAPDLAAVFDGGAEAMRSPAAETRFIKKAFPSCPSISVDYAVMEKASNVYVEIARFGWNDLGTWGSLYDNSPKNRQANVTQRCAVLAYESEGNIFAMDSKDKLVVVKGLNNCIVADSGNVLLICPLADEQQIKQIVDDVKQKTGERYL